MTLPLSRGNWLIFSPSGTGKSTFCWNLIKHRDSMFIDKPCKVYYFFSSWNKTLEQMHDNDIEFIKGLPSREKLDDIYQHPGHKVLILDDMINRITQNSIVHELFFIKSHHACISTIWITQILFNDVLRSLSQNTHYFVLMRSHRSISQVSRLGSQLGIKERLKQAFLHIVNDIEPFTYILIDLSPQALSQYSVRSHIFPNETTVIYKED